MVGRVDGVDGLYLKLPEVIGVEDSATGSSDDHSSSETRSANTLDDDDDDDKNNIAIFQSSNL